MITPKLDQCIQDEGQSSLAEALSEIRDHLLQAYTDRACGRMFYREFHNHVRRCDPKPTKGFLTEFETRLLELCLEAKGIMRSPTASDIEHLEKISWRDRLDVLMEEMSLYGKV